MQEVQAICDRVVIINRGKIVADDNITALQNQVVGETVLTVEFSQKVNLSQLSKIHKIIKVNELGGNRYQVFSSLNDDIRADIFRFAVENNLLLLELHKETTSVEDVFQKLTN